MINKRDKMKWVNRKCKDYLLKQGYENIYMFPHSRFAKDWNIPVGKDEKNQPIFAKFDGIALKKGELCLFQLKSNQKPPMNPYELFREKFNIPAKVLVYFDRKEVREF
jgi:hypothetical protein